MIDFGELVSGGRPPDGIPSIDRPQLESVADVDWLEPGEPVLSLTVDGRLGAVPRGAPRR